MLRSELTDDEADAVMANIYPGNRRWCTIGCGIPDDLSEDERSKVEAWLTNGVACACVGCIQGQLSWKEFSAWQKREAAREPTPWTEDSPQPPPPSLQDRLAAFKSRKRAAETQEVKHGE